MTASLTFSRRAVPTDPRLAYELDDGHLVEQHLNGDRQAFGALVDRYQTRLLNFVNRAIGDRDRAEALVQEVFIRAFRHLHGFDPSKPFGIYIYTIASNVAKNEAFRRSSIADLSGPCSSSASWREWRQEIAEITGCNAGTVRSRLRRARSTFAQVIKPLLE